MLTHAIPALVVSSCFSWLLLRFLIPFLASHLPDSPNARSAHQRVTPRGGGIVIVIIACFSAVLFKSPSGSVGLVFLVALPLAALGLVDDRINLPAALRYVFQLLTAVGLVLISPLPLHIAWLSVPLLLFAITAIINFTNFIDGLDGLAAGCMLVLLSTALIAFQGLALLPVSSLIGATFGFLVWNWSPAKIFMGDVGSTFLGAVFAGFVLQAPSWSDALSLLLVATPLLGDAFFCVQRRLFVGQPIFQAHRLHLYQRLHRAGWPHARVSSLYIFATALLSIALLAGGLPWVLTLSVVVLILGVWLDQRVAVPFLAASES
jgi:Fuc2NAc and GlcNAc transferase